MGTCCSTRDKEDSTKGKDGDKGKKDSGAKNGSDSKSAGVKFNSMDEMRNSVTTLLKDSKYL